MLTLLYQLQKLEAREAAILAAQKNCIEYQQVRELKEGFERQKQELLQGREQLSALQQQVQALPREIAETNDKLDRERAAVYDGRVANIREYNARQAQISVLEEKSAALVAEHQQRQCEYQRGLRHAKQLQQSLEEHYQQLSQQYRQYDDLRQGWQQELSGLAADKELLLTQIEGADLAWYEKQKPLFAGLPVAKLDNNRVCDGCRTMVTPMLHKRTVQKERTRCEKCGRYLFVETEG
jgi:predicted  nucleic acid-binding Zn-ribbon protein